MSGGEALLRPALVRRLAETAREVGTRSAVLSGMFFAAFENIPKLIEEAIRSVDHFSASIDVFHEREVPRARVFRVLADLLSRGMDVSLHVVGRDATDPYIASVVEEAQKFFDDRVPMLVNELAAAGRGKALLPARAYRSEDGKSEADPCAMAAWPVVGFDGAVIACGNDDVFETRPSHLVLGHIAQDDWHEIRERSLRSQMVRALRILGPKYIAERIGGQQACDGYCKTCMTQLDGAEIGRQVADVMMKPSTALFEREVRDMQLEAGAKGFARCNGLAEFADLVTLGAPA